MIASPLALERRTCGLNASDAAPVTALGDHINLITYMISTSDRWMKANYIYIAFACICVQSCSIGSLAKEMEEAGVENVTVRKAVFVGTQNGLRIKSWARPSNGFVQRVRFLGALMKNVQNPILIDQSYCPHNINCPSQVRNPLGRSFIEIT
jgi:polygalacturonase